ncbi:MAG: hypothetical protein RMY36_015465 [Nostoc sp. SerVER01]
MRWLEMLKSDAELAEASGVTLENLRTKAAEILAQLAPQSDTVEAKPPKENKRKKTKKSKKSDSDGSISKTLFEVYRDTTENLLTRCAISYSNPKSVMRDKMAEKLINTCFLSPYFLTSH